MLVFEKYNYKSEVEITKKMAGKTRASDLKVVFNHIDKKYGQRAKKKVIKEVKRIGYSVPDIKKTSDFAWLSPALPNLSLLALMKLYNWSVKDLYEFGQSTLILHPISKIIIRYFISLKKVLSRGEKDHRDHNSVGNVRLEKIDEKKKQAVISISNFYPPTVLLDYFWPGIYAKIVELTTGSNKVKVFRQEEKSDDNKIINKFFISW